MLWVGYVMIKKLLIISIVLFSIGLSAQPADISIGGARDIYDGSLYPDKAVRTYSQTERIFPTRVIKAGGKPSPLLQSKQQLSALKFTSEGKIYDFDLKTKKEVAQDILATIKHKF